MKNLYPLALSSFDEKVEEAKQVAAMYALESGKVVYLPQLPFSLTECERPFLDPAILDGKAKNISYDRKADLLKGYARHLSGVDNLQNMLKRYASLSRQLVENLFPLYKPYLEQARTSFRPAEAFGRKTSCRKDDRRLHVDAFPSSPVHGKRILRCFTNVNPDNKPRVWKIGEPFLEVVRKMAPDLSAPLPFAAQLLRCLGLTKKLRSPYDHYMLQIHNQMKEDSEYQRDAEQELVEFPAKTTWLVFTDQVSHAALSGQHLFEQSFYIPIQAMQNPQCAPLNVLQNALQKSLV